jgi:asparagine synthetase B (glutamine-hydrolysing)
VTALKNALKNAVKKDVEVMSQINLSLSGLDSSLLLALVKKISYKPICAYTVSDNEAHPDILYSKKYCKIMNIKHRALIVDKTTLLKRLKQIGEKREKIRHLVLETISSEGVNELMAGDGGDELMMGYYGFKRSFLIKRLYEEKRFPSSLNFNFEKLLKTNWSKTPFIYPLIYYWLELKEELVEIKSIADEVGIKIFLPYLDEEVIQVSSRIPPELKLGKTLLKKIASTYYPEELLKREKIGVCSAFRCLDIEPDKNISTILRKYTTEIK